MHFILFALSLFVFDLIPGTNKVVGEQGWRSGESARLPTNVSRVRFPDLASYVG